MALVEIPCTFEPLDLNGKRMGDVLLNMFTGKNRKKNIEKVKTDFKYAFSKVMNEQQYKEAVEKLIDNKTDEQIITLFEGMLSQFADENGIINGPTMQDLLKEEAELMENREYQQKAVAFTRKAKLTCDKKSEEIIAKIRKSAPSDTINIDHETDFYLQDLLGANNSRLLRSDIFFAKTVPLLDCVISVDETKQGGIVCTFRIIIFDDYKEKIDEATASQSTDGILVGAILMESCPYIAFPIYVLYGSDYIVVNEKYEVIKTRSLKQNEMDITIGAVRQGFSNFYRTWYGIQVTLLHPRSEEIYKNASHTFFRCGNKETVSYIRKAKYIKKHVIDVKDIENVINSTQETENKRNYNRNCLVWYVIGHWRTLKNGRKIFIAPYWKGELRKIKQNLSNNGRIREIDEHEIEA